jgi:hypothetical protein
MPFQYAPGWIANGSGIQDALAPGTTRGTPAVAFDFDPSSSRVMGYGASATERPGSTPW